MKEAKKINQNELKCIGWVKITIGMPPKCLNPNVPAHWGKEYAAKKKLRERVSKTVRVLHPNLVDAGWDRAKIKYDFYHKEVRTRDDDNYRAMMKSARDGFGPQKFGRKNNIIAGCGLVKDDTNIKDNMPVGFHIDPNERVEITLYKMEQ